MNKIYMSVLVISGLLYAGNLSAEKNSITIYPDREVGEVNRNVLGTSFPGFDLALRDGEKKHSYGYADYGSGVWSPNDRKSVSEVIELAKDAGISSIRFTTNNYYNWKSAIGNGREHFLFGIDEFLKTCREIGAEPVFTIPYQTTDVVDAADFVEYLNAQNDVMHPWARERARNGNVEPYEVKYFEIGNEIFDPKYKVTPEEYAYRFLKYYEAMKAVDSKIKIGAVINPSYWNREWNRRVMNVIREKIDFGSIHIYPAPFPRINDPKIERADPLKVFAMALALPELQYEVIIQEIRQLLEEKAGRSIPLAVTEHNGGFAGNKPFQYRHSIGSALLNAELIRIFMKPDNNIVLANYHHFSNGHWGMVSAYTNYMTHDYGMPIKYFKRPTYYIYELYKKHFGSLLIETDVQSASYALNEDEEFMQKVISNMDRGTAAGNNLLPSEWEIKPVSGVAAEERNGVLEILFSNPREFNYFHAFKKVDIKPNTYYKLSGYIKTDALADREGICLMIRENSLLRLRPSLAHTEKLMGTSDWKYVHVMYKTPPDAESVSVKVRRIGKIGPLKGKVFIRDVKLEEFTPDTLVPFLSVNASKNIDGSIVYLMVINKNMKESVNASIRIKDFMASGENETWIMSGPEVYATNEKNTDTVRITRRMFTANGTSFDYTFEPYSLTAIEIKKDNRLIYK